MGIYLLDIIACSDIDDDMLWVAQSSRDVKRVR
jgi:hypothetical protein